MMSDGDFAKLRAIVYDQTGITIGETRKSLLVSRLRPRLRDLGLSEYGTYIARVAADEAERQELTNRVTTNETYFYRTPRVWTYFTDSFIPDFLAAKHGRPMRVWSAAASTGEEAHTIGTFLEETRSRTPGFDYAVLGTDISSRVIGVATEGVYRGRPVARFRADQPDLFARHMTGSDDEGWQVAPQIRSRIRFRQHNLLEPLTNTAQFDVVFLRNVLIYFTPADQERILGHVRRLLHPGGVLFIGESESLKFIETDFEQVEPIIYRPVARTAGVPA
ncbi:chemotaxis protein methyltransferase [Primorskyibacter flagellatus]|uniref:Chemotaxis protein methyltransferase n=2 Tax=Primorskyibacter flagellatus TaxID=1387277 RepID=A0A917AGZ2_9RHOB|nr:chemotaxis protein methyltransferase [Primorskyibacter flagellatus]